MIPVLEKAGLYLTCCHCPPPSFISHKSNEFLRNTQRRWQFQAMCIVPSNHANGQSCIVFRFEVFLGQTSVETDDGWKYTEHLDDVRNVSGCCHFRYHQCQFRHNIILYVIGSKIAMWWFIIQQGWWTQYSNNISCFFSSIPSVVIFQTSAFWVQ